MTTQIQQAQVLHDLHVKGIRWCWSIYGMQVVQR